jgi:hypothetical protein
VIAEVELLAGCVAARAALAQGRDAEGFKAAQLVGGVGTSLWWWSGVKFGLGGWLMFVVCVYVWGVRWVGGWEVGARQRQFARASARSLQRRAAACCWLADPGLLVMKAGCGMDVGLLH